MPAFREDDPAVQLELEAVPAGSPAALVARQLLQQLTSGVLAPGVRLPSERALAERLGVGRSAVREALASLEILGVVQVRPGSGTYLQGGASELLPKTLSWGLMLAAARTDELLELRSGLEAQAASLAAERASDAEIEAMVKYVDAMGAKLGSPKAFAAADLRFHVTLARASGNEILADLLQTIRSLLQVWTERRLRTRAQAQDAHREHRIVLAAITAKDPAAAAEAMKEHMVTASTRLRAR